MGTLRLHRAQSDFLPRWRKNFVFRHAAARWQCNGGGAAVKSVIVRGNLNVPLLTESARPSVSSERRALTRSSGFSLALNVTLRNWINIAGSHMNEIEIVNGYHLGVISLVKGYYTMYTEVN